MKSKVNLLIIVFFIINLSSFHGQDFSKKNGVVSLLIIYADTVKSDISPLKAINGGRTLFTYFIGEDGEIWDDGSRTGRNEYRRLISKEKYDSLNLDGGLLYQLNNEIDTLICKSKKSNFINIKNNHIKNSGFNYIYFTLEVIYTKLNVSKTNCTPMPSILDKPSGIIIHEIKRIVRIDCKIPIKIKRKIIKGFPEFKDFVRRSMFCYEGLN